MKSMSRIVLYLGLAIVLIGVIIGVYFFTLGQKDLANAKADYALTARELYADFEKDEDAATQKYVDKILEVSGPVYQVDMNTDSTLNVVLMNQEDFGGVSCSFNTLKDPSSIDISKGDMVVIRGICAGYLLPDVLLNNCVIVGTPLP